MGRDGLWIRFLGPNLFRFRRWCLRGLLLLSLGGCWCWLADPCWSGRRQHFGLVFAAEQFLDSRILILDIARPDQPTQNNDSQCQVFQTHPLRLTNEAR